MLLLCELDSVMLGIKYEQGLRGITPEHAKQCLGCCTAILATKKRVQNAGFQPLTRCITCSGMTPESLLMYGCCVTACNDPVLVL